MLSLDHRETQAYGLLRSTDRDLFHLRVILCHLPLRLPDKVINNLYSREVTGQVQYNIATLTLPAVPRMVNMGKINSTHHTCILFNLVLL